MAEGVEAKLSMARRSISTILMSLITALMVGFREATGVAPPPPVISSEEVEWLSPGLDNDLGFEVVLEEAEHIEIEMEPKAIPRRERRVVRAAKAIARSIFGRHK